MSKPTRNLAASVHARLLKRAKAENRPFTEFLQYYAMERFLYRLSRSPEVDRFVLKGALMLPFWGGPLTRATRDVDLLARRTGDVDDFVSIVRSCLQLTDLPDDGMSFDPDGVTGEEIRADATYQGVRVRLRGTLGKARVVLQVDIGFGDAVVPAPVRVLYPSLLDGEEPHLLAYTPESAIAEKYEAMVSLDLANSRMKDFYDVWLLAGSRSFDGAVFCEALRATFARRKTALPTTLPTALTPTFATDATKRTQWKAFVRKTRLSTAPPDLPAAVDLIRALLWPPTLAAAAGEFDRTWPPGGPWVEPGS